MKKESIFQLCEELYRSDFTEEALIISLWLPDYVENLQLKDLAIFKVWIQKYINS